jgi:hypothetical protein
VVRYLIAGDLGQIVTFQVNDLNRLASEGVHDIVLGHRDLTQDLDVGGRVVISMACHLFAPLHPCAVSVEHRSLAPLMQVLLRSP